MNPYAMAGLGADNRDAASLRERLVAWHDAMVNHERKLRVDPSAHLCDDECPHVEAAVLWREAVKIMGEGARQLTFLRTRATAAARRDIRSVTA